MDKIFRRTKFSVDKKNLSEGNLHCVVQAELRQKMKNWYWSKNYCDSEKKVRFLSLNKYLDSSAALPPTTFFIKRTNLFLRFFLFEYKCSSVGHVLQPWHINNDNINNDINNDIDIDNDNDNMRSWADFYHSVSGIHHYCQKGTK